MFCSIASHVLIEAYHLTYLHILFFYKGRDWISKHMATLMYLKSEINERAEVGNGVWICLNRSFLEFL